MGGSCRSWFILRILLDAGAEVKLPNAVGKSPLHFVCSYMIAPIIPIFIEYGANVDMTDIDFRTPLYDCMTYTGHAPYSKSVQRHRSVKILFCVDSRKLLMNQIYSSKHPVLINE